jgi:two-component system phosphate regulon response regulator PhoB
MKGSVFIVDDDRSIIELLVPALKEEGYRVAHAGDSNAAFDKLSGAPTDIVLLDIELPGISGLQLLELLKKDSRTAGIPIIMLTSRAEEATKVKGFKTGAEDYIVKPFSTKELLARIEALLKRTRQSGHAERILEGGGIRMNLERQEVTTVKGSVSLSPIEFSLLALFLTRKGHVLSYRVIGDAIGKGNKDMTSATVYSHIKNIRLKLGSFGHRIETVHGIGYKFSEAGAS